MDEARAVLGRDVAVDDDVVRVGDVDQVEGPGVGPALHVAAGVGRVLDGPALAEGGSDQRGGHHEPVAVLGRDDVVDVGVGGDGRVGDEGPGGRGPHEQVGGAGERAGGQGEADVDRRVDDGLVALRQLVVGEAGAAARAVRRDAVVLDQETLVEDDLERPPHALDVGRVHRAIGLGEVDPVAHPLGHRLELTDVAEHRLTAAGVELRHPEVLDVALAREPELLLHGELDGQAVAVPAGLAGDVVALHRPVAREDVLEDPGLDVVGAGHAVGCRRAFVEDPERAAPGGLDAAREDVALAPQREDLAVDRREVDLRGDRTVEGHGVVLLRSHPAKGRVLGEVPGSRGTTLLGAARPLGRGRAHSWSPAAGSRRCPRRGGWRFFRQLGGDARELPGVLVVAVQVGHHRR